MRDLLSGLLGVPAAMLVAAGPGIIVVTIWSRIRRTRRGPIRWAHLALGVVFTVAGVALLAAAVSVGAG